MDNKKWYLGLDIGTNSVGFCATDTEYNILTKNSKLQCGSRLFEDAKDASERRLYRSSRRRMARKKERINLLQQFFDQAISSVDPAFFIRLKESNYHLEDKSTGTASKYPLFNDPDFTDIEYYKKYPTIYHLRCALMNDDITDPRLLYLACHHLIKYRGHFLFEQFNSDSDADLIGLVDAINDDLNGIFSEENETNDILLSTENVSQIYEIINDKKVSDKDQWFSIFQILNPTANKIVKKICDTLKGSKIDLKSIAPSLEIDDELKESLKDFRFGSEQFDDTYSLLEQYLDDQHLSLLMHLKQFYDFISLNRILSGFSTVAAAKVDRYNLHHEQLLAFKRFVKKYKPESYNSFFRKNFVYDRKKDSNGTYQNYVKSNKSNGKKVLAYSAMCIEKKQQGHIPVIATYETFLSYTKKFIDTCEKNIPEIINDEDFKIIKSGLESDNFCKKHNLKENSYIPYQLTLKELDLILNRQRKNFSFLTDDVVDKIKRILTFKIPYYVGPLSEKDKGTFSWIVKKPGHEKQKVLPWNFDDIVDRAASGEEFIKRMTSKCTYLRNEDVLPKQSLLYQKYLVLNELNNVSIDNNKIDQIIKKAIFEELCCKGIKLSNTKIENFLRDKHLISKENHVTYNGSFNESLSSFDKLKKILGDKFNDTMCEDIILWHTVFANEKDPVKSRIIEKYGQELNSSLIDKLSRLAFTGWGRLSRRFLTELGTTDVRTGETALSIIHLLEDTNLNLMQILNSDNYSPSFINLVNQENTLDTSETLNYDYVKNLYCSPTVKRSIWQAIRISKELTQINGCDPEKIFIEVTRTNDLKNKGKVTDSRRKQLQDKFNKTKKIKDDLSQLLDEFNKRTDLREFRGDRLYLYFMQLGRCMYSGEKINLDELYDRNLYDIDHIYPQSIILDDSLDNKVLVKRHINALKSDNYPLSSDIRNSQRAFWDMLKKYDFISETKYNRLISSKELTSDIIGGFLNRQLVSTNIAVKETAKALSQIYPGNNRIVYSKAGHVSDFRHKFRIVKCREINNIHHGHDAYLNIVVGNVWHSTYLRYWNSNCTFNENNALNKLFDKDKPGFWSTSYLDKIRNYILNSDKYLNKFVVTKSPIDRKGAFYDATIYPKGVAQFQLHQSPEYAVTKSGGYRNQNASFACVVEYKDIKGKKKIDILPIFIKDKKYASNNLLEYVTKYFGCVEPRLLYSHIPFDSLIEVDGVRYYLRGVSSEVQLVVSTEWQPSEDIVKIVHDISSCLAKINNKEIDEPETGIESFEYSKGKYISKLDNNKVFNSILNQLNKPFYEQYSFVKKYKLGKLNINNFFNATILEQMKFILSMLNLVTLNGSLFNAKLIDGASNETCKYRLSNCKDISASLISQSVTGLYEKRIKIIDPQK